MTRQDPAAARAYQAARRIFPGPRPLTRGMDLAWRATLAGQVEAVQSEVAAATYALRVRLRQGRH